MVGFVHYAGAHWRHGCQRVHVILLGTGNIIMYHIIMRGQLALALLLLLLILIQLQIKVSNKKTTRFNLVVFFLFLNFFSSFYCLWTYISISLTFTNLLFLEFFCIGKYFISINSIFSYNFFTKIPI